MDDILDWNEAENVEMEMSQKTLEQVRGDHLTTDLLETDKVKVKLPDYLAMDQGSEGTLSEFFDKIRSGNHNFSYLENVEPPQNLIKDYGLKWNLRVQNFIPTALKGEVPGVTTPTHYFGSKYAAFPWHREDGDLRSLSYLIAGAPKVYINIYI